MPHYYVRVAVVGLPKSWHLVRTFAHSAQRAIDLVDDDERAEGYTPIAFKAENDRDAHDVASRGEWPFLSELESRPA